MTFNDHLGARTVVDHLLWHGYQDVVCVAGEIGAGPAEGREGGRRQAMESPDRPRAICATTDEQALVTIRTATSLGLRVPDGLAVVGFDGVREARLGSFPLTTVGLPFEEFAVRAFDALGAVFHDGGSPSAPVVPDGTLSVGVTCGCAPGPTA
ncbi:substrate-binding domain-containing protein [Actinosynnema sp. NPDC023587]|uniref:substrate-binding domain-containing protein n=1 Tax=Actinosynnema sp. NPDC023587 TaxID=3154695 RepID=UPI0033FA3E60